MLNYKSTELKNINESIIFSFDFERDLSEENSNNTHIAFGFSSDDGKDNVEKNIYLLKNTIFQENNYTNCISTYKDGDKTILSNYGDQVFGKEYLIMSSSYDDENDVFSWSFYIQNDSPEENSSKIYMNNKIYERISNDVCKLNPIFIEDYCFENDISKFSNKTFTISAELDGEEILICPDYQIEIKDSLNFSTVLLMSNFDADNSSTISGCYYTYKIDEFTQIDGNKETSKLRFIISNKGRDFSIASYNKDENKFDKGVTYIFNTEDKDFNNVSVRFSINTDDTENVKISNISSNF